MEGSGMFPPHHVPADSPFVQTLLQCYTDVTGKPGKMCIRDRGCGAGFFSILLAKEGHEVFGIDLTPEMIENAIQLAEEENADCCFQVMDAEHPMFEMCIRDRT